MGAHSVGLGGHPHPTPRHGLEPSGVPEPLGGPDLLQLIQTELDEEPGDHSPSQGSLRFRHKPPMEFKGPDGIHVVHGSTGTLLATDLNSLPEDDQKGLGRSLETLTTAEATAFERNARTESAKSTPLHKLRDVIMESPLEITEL